MIVGYVGRCALSSTIMERMGSICEVRALPLSGAEPSMIASCDAIIVAQHLPAGIREFLTDALAIPRSATQPLVVIDQTVTDPEITRHVAQELASVGVLLVDAPIQCELAARYPDGSAILCGGAPAAIAQVRPLLECMGSKLILFGESGNGHAARVLVGAVAASVRLLTYECAALACKNGLSVPDMVTVLNRSSGSSSATERVLPHLPSRRRTSDATISELASGLQLASRMSMREGAPMMLANQVAAMVQAAANQLGPDAAVDDLASLVELGADLRFT